MADDASPSIDWPRRRPFSPSEIRLRAIVSTNVRSELIGKVSLTIVTVIVNSPWLWLLWAAQFVVLLGVWVARTELERDRTDRALVVLAIAHGAGGLGAVVALPVIAPLVMLVWFGDLTLSGFCSRRAVRTFVALCLALVALTAYLSLGGWSNLLDEVPIALVAVAFVLQGLASGSITSLTSREIYTQLKDRGDRLLSATERLRTADREERLRVADRLSSVTMADLAAISDQIEVIRHKLAVGDEGRGLTGELAGATALVKVALARLRELSHGLYPDVLHQHGLVAAISSLDHLGDGRVNGEHRARIVLVEHPTARLPAAIEAFFHAVIVAVIQATPADEVRAGITIRRGHAELLVVGEHLALEPDSQERLRDQASAVLGDMEVSPPAVIEQTAGSGERLTFGRVHVAAPLEQPEPITAPDAVEVNPQPILRRFILGSLVLCGAGVLVAAIVWMTTQLVSVAVVFAVLCAVLVSLLLAGLAERGGRARLALALLSFETSISGIVVTAAVPEFAPTTALIVVLPMVLGLPYLTSRHLDVVGAVATVMVTVVALLGLLESGVVDDVALPAGVSLLLLAPTSLAVALLAVVALADGRSTIDATNDRLQATMVELAGAFDATRRQVERDLHDGAQQQLAALAIQFGVVRRIISSPDRADRVLVALMVQIHEARRELQMLVEGSFGDVLRSIGVGPALRRTSVNSTTIVTNGVESLPADVALVAYFVCHEAMQNATKHAGAAAAIEVDIRVLDDHIGTRVEFCVADDGVGCDPAQLTTGHGIGALRSRLEEVGGTLVVSSEPGRGTTVSGVIPVVLGGSVETGHGRTYPIP